MDKQQNIIKVFGITGCTAPFDIEKHLCGCAAICSSKRLLNAISSHINSLSLRPDIIPITPLADMVEGIDRHLKKGNCIILASGDPLFFGIGKRLVSVFGRERIEFHPALSAIQLACARFKIPWDDAHIVSLHGRSNESVFGHILTQAKNIIFTDTNNSPDLIASKLINWLKRAGAYELASHIRLHVAEELDCPGERLRTLGLKEAATAHFSPLNVVIVQVDECLSATSTGLGLLESEINHLRGLITKNEIRAVVLHRLRLCPGLTLWDIGAGSGSISIEAARLYADITPFAVEMDKGLQQIIRENIRRYRLFNVIPVDGKAPEILKPLPDPQRVFIGGSKGRLGPIIEYCSQRLGPGGIMVATAVLEATAKNAPALMEEAGLKVECSRINVSRRSGARGPEERLNEITIIRGIKEV